MTADSDVQALLEEAYGRDIDLLDSFTGALAEGNNLSSTAVLGDLLQVSTPLWTGSEDGSPYNFECVWPRYDNLAVPYGWGGCQAYLSDFNRDKHLGVPSS